MIHLQKTEICILKLDRVNEKQFVEGELLGIKPSDSIWTAENTSGLSPFSIFSEILKIETVENYIYFVTKSYTYWSNSFEMRHVSKFYGPLNQS